MQQLGEIIQRFELATLHLREDNPNLKEMATIEDDSESFSTKISANELLGFQRDLKQEKELLEKMLAKIDDQVHRLQVEQLHLLGIMNKSLKDSPVGSPSHNITNDNHGNPTNERLDLSVAATLNYFKEELDEEDDI